MLVFELMRFLVELATITAEMGWSNWQILGKKIMLKVNLLPLFLCLIFYYHNSKVFAKAKYPFPPPPATAYLSFLSLKLLGVSLLPPGRDTSPLQGDPLSSPVFHQTSLVICQCTFSPGWRQALCEWSVLSKNATHWPSQVSNLNLSSQSSVH